jgi:argonaute-like protein implicated in RNA metabolism and viral defense
MKNFFQSVRKPKETEYIAVVSGLPRSGTSMMMKMLEAGGLPPLTDEIRTADDDNPKGYYEFERVKKMPDGDIAWVEETHGKSVKVISALLEHLPPDYSYRVLFMERKMDEILASQHQMLVRSGKPTDKVSDEKLAEMYSKHLAMIKNWLNKQPNFSVLYLDYNAILADPDKYSTQINQYLGQSLNAEKMAGVIDPNLYRQRK